MNAVTMVHHSWFHQSSHEMTVCHVCRQPVDWRVSEWGYWCPTHGRCLGVLGTVIRECPWSHLHE